METKFLTDAPPFELVTFNLLAVLKHLLYAIFDDIFLAFSFIVGFFLILVVTQALKGTPIYYKSSTIQTIDTTSSSALKSAANEKTLREAEESCVTETWNTMQEITTLEQQLQKISPAKMGYYISHRLTGKLTTIS